MKSPFVLFIGSLTLTFTLLSLHERPQPIASADCNCSGSECESYKGGATIPTPPVFKDTDDLCGRHPLTCGKLVPNSTVNYGKSGGCSGDSSATVKCNYEKEKFSFTGQPAAQAGFWKVSWDSNFKSKYSGWASLCSNSNCASGNAVTAYTRVAATFWAEDTACSSDQSLWANMGSAVLEATSNNCSSASQIVNGETDFALDWCCDCESLTHIREIEATIDVEHIVDNPNQLQVSGNATMNVKMNSETFTCSVQTQCP